MSKHVCKKCFKTAFDDSAADHQLFMSGDDMICPSCGQKGPVVSNYFKYGEQYVTSDGKHIVGEARYVGVNPNYSFFNNSYPYADVDNYKGNSNDVTKKQVD